jgi:hypothetical protein
VHLAGAHLPLDDDSERARAQPTSRTFSPGASLASSMSFSRIALSRPAEKIVPGGPPVDDAACRFRGVSGLVVHF